MQDIVIYFCIKSDLPMKNDVLPITINRKKYIWSLN